MAGVSRLLPIVKKNKLSRAKTSARTVSTRFGSAEEPRSSFGMGALEDGPACIEDWSSRIAFSLVTARSASMSQRRLYQARKLTLLDDRIVDGHYILRANEFGRVLLVSLLKNTKLKRKAHLLQGGEADTDVDQRLEDGQFFLLVSSHFRTLSSASCSPSPVDGPRAPFPSSDHQ